MKTYETPELKILSVEVTAPMALNISQGDGEVEDNEGE